MSKGGKLMLFKFTSDELRVLCRRQLEAFEYWGRRLIHQQLSSNYGGNYFNYFEGKDNFIIKKSIREATLIRYNANKKRYTRIVDALLLDDIISIICNPNLYKKHFRYVLKLAYPNGNDEARVFLNRLVVPRNNLSHANPISLRQAEQVICYTNDFIDSVKVYYKKENIYMNYNVPQIIKISDSLGNECYRESCVKTSKGIIWAKESKNNYVLRPGDIYRVEIEVDSAFNIDEYEIHWNIPNDSDVLQCINNPFLEILIQNKHVNENFHIKCQIKSKNEWHKHTYFDDELSIHLMVLPPI